ncbi:MAG: phosphopantetheine-binding protein [Mycobacteriales bacterium]
MSTPDDVSARLLTLSAEQLSVPPAELRPDAVLTDDLGVDSLGAIEWGMTIEDAFGISLPEDAWEYVRTYGMVDELVRRLGTKRQA